MNYAAGVLGLIGIALLVIGYRRNSRKLMFAAAILLLFGGSVIRDFADGFRDGFNGIHK